MQRPLLGPLVGASCGAMASLGLATLLHNPAYLLVMTPGAILLGALLGWTVARIQRLRTLAGLVFGVLCAFANGVLSGVLNALMGDVCRLGSGAERVSEGIAIGLIGCAILWMALVPIGLVSGGLLVALTRRKTA